MRWTEAIPMTDVSAATVTVSFLGLDFSFWHATSHITDHASQFESELFLELSTLIGFHLRTPYHPQSNRIIERQYRH